MKAFSGLLRGGLSASAVLAIVSGCGGSQTQTNALVPGQSNAATAELGRLGVGSSMAADAQSTDLLYVADAGDGSVHVYSFPAGKPQGRLLDVRANTLCAGKNGDVFAPAGNEVLRYAHGGTRPIVVMHDPLGTAPQFCAVDSTTGNLAVSGGSASRSGVAIYAGAKGSPTIYAARNDARYGSVAYDNDGNLFALTTAGKVVELANGGKRFRELDWSGARPAAGSIQWDGKYLAVASGARISRFTVSGYQAIPAGEIAIKGAANVPQFWIHKDKVVIPDSRGVALYGYPAGGNALAVIKDARAAQAVTVSRGKQSSFAITTYHYDNFRTGWDNDETTLTYGNVNAASFGLLHTIALDDQVDTQPLLIPNVTTNRGGKSGSAHDVVYVTTESNTIYAVDASSGTILFQTNLGAPVPAPLGCNNNGPNVGIDGTPVIDRAAGVMYVIAYTLEGSVPTYRIHELSLCRSLRRNALGHRLGVAYAHRRHDVRL